MGPHPHSSAHHRKLIMVKPLRSKAPEHKLEPRENERRNDYACLLWLRVVRLCRLHTLQGASFRGKETIPWNTHFSHTSQIAPLESNVMISRVSSHFSNHLHDPVLLFGPARNLICLTLLSHVYDRRQRAGGGMAA